MESTHRTPDGRFGRLVRLSYPRVSTRTTPNNWPGANIGPLPMSSSPRCCSPAATSRGVSAMVRRSASWDSGSSSVRWWPLALPAGREVVRGVHPSRFDPAASLWPRKCSGLLLQAPCSAPSTGLWPVWHWPAFRRSHSWFAIVRERSRQLPHSVRHVRHSSDSRSQPARAASIRSLPQEQ